MNNPLESLLKKNVQRVEKQQNNGSKIKKNESMWEVKNEEGSWNYNDVFENKKVIFFCFILHILKKKIRIRINKLKIILSKKTFYIETIIETFRVYETKYLKFILLMWGLNEAVKPKK